MLSRTLIICLNKNTELCARDMRSQYAADKPSGAREKHPHSNCELRCGVYCSSKARCYAAEHHLIWKMKEECAKAMYIYMYTVRMLSLCIYMYYNVIC